MEDLVYWVWLQMVLGVGSAKVKRIIELYETPKNFYKAGVHDWKLTGLFTQSNLNKIESIKLSNAESVIRMCEEKSQRIVPFTSNEYPNRLRAIYSPPALLYVNGKIPDVDNKISISIVGTRTPTEYGMNMAFDFAFKLAKSEAIVISGGALGIDITAHRGALMANGECICVLGCGLDYNYLLENKDTRNLISKNGAVISEYPPKTPPRKQNFPIRNRIISGLSLGVLVVEAGAKSGSLITARSAADEGRDVFAIPGNAGNFLSQGTNNLIKEGAKLVTNSKEILEEYLSETRIQSLSSEVIRNDVDLFSEYESDDKENFIKNEKVTNNTASAKLDVNLSGNAKKILKVLTHKEKHIDDISIATGLTTSQSLMAITELELLELIMSYPGKRYKLL